MHKVTYRVDIVHVEPIAELDDSRSNLIEIDGFLLAIYSKENVSGK
jgi:hypothetical protein